MFPSLHHFLSFRLDLLLLILTVAFGCWLTGRYVRRHTTKGLPARIWLIAAALLGTGGLLAEWAARERTEHLRNMFAGFGPTYAAELAAQGHAEITAETGPHDPLYLQLIEAQKLWLRVNPMIADIYTFRRDASGDIRLIVDSETDYDRNGTIAGTHEQRTPIGEIYTQATPKLFAALAGEPQFETDIITDRWGSWVSSFTPVLDNRGRVEAAVGIDYPADSWLFSLIVVRGMVLSVTLVVAIILLASSAFISVLSAEIAHRRAVQTSLEEASESAFAASAAKSEFLALMSHEVRTPLSAIMGFAGILAQTDLNAKQRRYIETINRAGTGLVDLLNGILDYTKAESGTVKLERIPWAPALLVHEAMELMSIRALEKGLQLNFDNQLPDTLTLFGDPTRVRQILLNLLSNAVKFTPQGFVTVRAAWQPETEQSERGRLTLEVIDTGPGIPADKIPLLFQAFSQADAATTRRHGGTGLGLAVCRRLTDLLGGTIELQSTPGSGCVFTFELASDSADACGLVYRPSEDGTAPPVPLWTRALVVDDTKLNRELLKVMLRRLGLEADLAAGGAEAVRLAAENRYAIIFTDLEMPEMDGFDTAREIRRQEPLGRHTPIVAVSAMTAAGTRERCIVAGMDDYMTKPVYLPALRSMLEALIPRFKVETQPPIAAA